MFQASLTSNLAQSMLDAVKYSNHDKAGDHIFQAPPQAKVGLVVSVNKDSLRPKAPKAWSRESVHIGSEEKAIVAQKACAWTHQTLLAVHVPEERQGWGWNHVLGFAILVEAGVSVCDPYVRPVEALPWKHSNG